jgi:hypothetical protein
MTVTSSAITMTMTRTLCSLDSTPHREPEGQ